LSFQLAGALEACFNCVAQPYCAQHMIGKGER